MAYERKQDRYHQTYVWRKGSENNEKLNKAIYVIRTHKMSQLSKEELLRYGGEIIKEARIRMSLLTRSGITSSPAYKYVKIHGLKFGTKNITEKELRHRVLEAFNFLHSKTSTIEGAIEHEKWLYKHLGYTTDEQREKIWEVVHRFESTHPGQFINYNYDETIRKITEVTIAQNFNVDRATQALQEILERAGSFRDVDIDFTGKEMWFPTIGK